MKSTPAFVVDVRITLRTVCFAPGIGRWVFREVSSDDNVGNNDDVVSCVFSGEYDLKLSPVTLDDEGTYQCQVGTGKRDEPAIRSEKAKLTILVPPGRPRILQGESVVTAENVPLELECVSDGGKPPAEVSGLLFYVSNVYGL